MRKYVVLVGTLLDDIRITRLNAVTVDTATAGTELIKVPIMYAPKDKMMARITQDPAIDRPSATPPLPMISFEMGQMRYDSKRKLDTITKNVIASNNPKQFNYQYNPVPYNIDFKVYVYAKNAEDGTKIIEQILPYFTPDWTLAVNLVPELGTVMNIPVILNNVNLSDNYDGDFKNRRAIVWELDLMVKGYLFGPVRQAYAIQFANTAFVIGEPGDNTSFTAVSVSVQPGLDANGHPTSNASITIPYQQISVNNDYGFVYNTEDFE